jgi:hypothetical protein
MLSMTDDPDDLEPIDLSASPPPAHWPAGWYADPWTAGQYRYWTGTTWTGETNRWGPTHAAVGADPWPPAPITTGYGLPTGEPQAAAPAPRSTRRGSVVAAVIALVLLVAASATVGYVIDSHSRSKSSAANITQPTTPGTTTPGGGTTPSTAAPSTDPDRRVLSDLVLHQSDVGTKRSVVLIPNGASISKPTLDLCNGTFPSEKLRTARLQVITVDAAGNTGMSSEGVLYKNPAAGAQAMRELASVSANCPHKAVESPVGEGSSETEFKAAPDTNWPRTPGVERQAYSMVSTAGGQSFESVAVYLRRGRVLLGLYFVKPNAAQAPIAGKRSIENIVAVFEARVAQVSPAVVNRRP